MKVCVIPARGGSKRIPRKNLKVFHGEPIIGRSIKTAIKSEVFDKIVVSTDDQEIAELAKSLGAEVPFLRPAKLSDDYATTADVIKHAIEEISCLGDSDFVCCLYATSPFTLATDLSNSLKQLLSDHSLDYVMSVASYEYPIQRSLKKDKNGKIKMFWPEHEITRSQDLEAAFHDAGMFYWGRAKSWVEKKSLLNGNCSPFEIPKFRVQDIDTEEDWKRAEYLFSTLTDIEKENLI